MVADCCNLLMLNRLDMLNMSCTKTLSILVPGVGAILLALLVSGCVGSPRATAPVAVVETPVVMSENNAPPASAAPLQNAAPSVAVPPAPVISAVVETKPSPAPMSPNVAKVTTPPAKPAAPPVKPTAIVQNAAPPTPTPNKPLTAPPNASNAATAAATKAAAPATQAKSATPMLDLKSLETRLKQTEAIGVFTKIALKNQVNDLLDQFRAFYAGRLNTTLAALRRPYEMLLQKVLALLQDADRALAGAIVASREAMWVILSDPAKFATI